MTVSGHKTRSELRPNELISAIALFLADVVRQMSIRWKDIADQG